MADNLDGNVFGNIRKPIPYAGLTEGGLVAFLNNLVSLVITLAGIFTLINLVAAGYQYLSANGQPQQISAAGNKILQSLIGLGIVAVSFVLAGIIGYVLFQDATILLKPKLFKL